MRYAILIVVMLISLGEVNGQGKILTSQYFQNLPAYSPAFTGAHDFLDIRTGFRKQWAGYSGAPQTGYISAYGALYPGHNRHQKHSLRVSDPSEYEGTKKNTGSKLGIGGYILSDQAGSLKLLESMLSVAAHIPVADHKYLSLGMSTGITNNRVDLEDLTVIDPINDPTYLSYVNSGNSNTFLNMSASIGYYSDRFYVSYGMMQLVNSLLSGNDEVNNEGASVRHNILAGFRIHMTDKLELLPNVFYRLEKNASSFFDVGARLRYNKNLTGGLAYRNDDTYIMMLGLTMSDKISLGYSYEYKTASTSQFNNSSHEIVLGIKLFNYAKYTPMW